MKKLILLFGILLILSSCADNKTINGHTYRPYGLLNQETCKNDSVQYEISGWAVFSGIVFVECIAPSIYVFGYNLYEPVGMKKDYLGNPSKGVVNE